MSTKIAFSIFILAIIFTGCSEEKATALQDQTLNITEISASDCKNNTKSAEDESQYIELSAVNRNQLKVTFINAVLNCCPGEIVASASIEDEILKVEFAETPEGGSCDCICSYDLECQISNMKDQKYDIEVYASSDLPAASFSFTFSSSLNMTYEIN